MDEILHQLICSLSQYLQGLYIQTVVVWDFWTINSITHHHPFFTPKNIFFHLWNQVGISQNLNGNSQVVVGLFCIDA